ncbi:hypothetical protein NEOLI_001860 [Neolecta irregularis DAH-3]|uniref:Uncharacterized protein n=1 Tax=Neolecta irregularis (strain DAH-3) TaxID=1198029 RepID=A0A1U7LH14_NEOID|nr:hypothetical protein NEOLI_001860 [Neolecta irregularis DAH-3]|eukprot:OLL21950.1 hypothetical protein NEOLI_001860 [Neolecta irregularis DAH-3]
MFEGVINLHHLNIASCYNLSLRGMQTFLQGQLPSTLESLNISWLFSVRGSWLTELKEDLSSLKWLDVRGIDDLTRRDIQAIQYRFVGIRIRLHEPLLDDDSVEGYLAFIKHYVGV